MKKCPQVEILELKEQVAELQTENDGLRKAILIWWRGSPEDTGSDVHLRSVAKELEEK
jgi:hypothetical protein